PFRGEGKPVSFCYETRFLSYLFPYQDLFAANDPLLLLGDGIHLSKDKGETWNLVFHTEDMAFFDLLVNGDVIHGSIREWDEYHGR
ncbi:MAG: hypothetical protein AAFV80_13940, partial [Bacteroidota bacterium]